MNRLKILKAHSLMIQKAETEFEQQFNRWVAEENTKGKDIIVSKVSLQATDELNKNLTKYRVWHLFIFYKEIPKQ